MDIKHQYGITPSCQTCILQLNHMQWLHQLRQKPDIVIIHPVIGSGLVIMNISEYINKICSILSDQSEFRLCRLPDNPSKMEHGHPKLHNHGNSLLPISVTVHNINWHNGWSSNSVHSRRN